MLTRPGHPRRYGMGRCPDVHTRPPGRRADLFPDDGGGVGTMPRSRSRIVHQHRGHRGFLLPEGGSPTLLRSIGVTDPVPVILDGDR